MRYWGLASEDPLSEAVGRRLLAELSGDVEISFTAQRGGQGYLRSRMDSWWQLAQRQGVLVLTDLDRVRCPSMLLGDWLQGKAQPVNLVLRVAVRSVESWVLADHQALATLLGPRVRPPHRPDELANPKGHLLGLAERAPRDVRSDLVRLKNAVPAQGLGYNARLTEWVRTTWSPRRAARLSPSLRTARERLDRVDSLLGARTTRSA
jgi:hypothetical protein